MIKRKWVPVSCQVTDPYYLLIWIFFCDKIVEHFFSDKTRSKIEELGNKNKDDFYILEA